MTAVALLSDPEDCETLQTERFLRQTQKKQGRGNLEQCIAETEKGDEAADSIAVTEVEVEGTTASADAAFSGGDLDGQTLSIELVEDDGEWMLDRITGFAEFNREGLTAAFRQDVEESSEELGAEATACLTDRIESASDEELEEIILSETELPLIALVSACA